MLMCSRRIRFLLSPNRTRKSMLKTFQLLAAFKTKAIAEISTAIFPYHTSRLLSVVHLGWKSGHARPCKATAKLFEEFLLAYFFFCCCRSRERTWSAANCWEFLARREAFFCQLCRSEIFLKQLRFKLDVKIVSLSAAISRSSNDSRTKNIQLARLFTFHVASPQSSADSLSSS